MLRGSEGAVQAEERYADALAQARRLGSLLNEILELTRQLAEAVDRKDQVSMRMVIAMREEPIRRADAADRAIKSLRDEIADAAERARFSELLAGRADAETGPCARALAERMAFNARTLQQIKEIDRVLNRKIARDRSVV